MAASPRPTMLGVVDPSTVAGTAAKAVSAVARFRPWATVKRHDRLAHEQYEDLITWARDDVQKEAQALDEAKERLNARNLLYSGQLGRELSRVRDEFSIRWRDRKREADRLLRAMREEEGASVRAWRRMRRRPWPINPWRGELSALTAGWEDEEVRRAAVQREVELYLGS
jgi:hypothetical protein